MPMNLKLCTLYFCSYKSYFPYKWNHLHFCPSYKTYFPYKWNHLHFCPSYKTYFPYKWNHLYFCSAYKSYFPYKWNHHLFFQTCKKFLCIFFSCNNIAISLVQYKIDHFLKILKWTALMVWNNLKAWSLLYLSTFCRTW